MITQITQEGAFDATLRRQINANFNNLSFVTQGNIWWVRPVNGSDSNDGKTSATAFKTCAAALAAATANQNDIVLLCGEGNALASATDFQATTLNWNKDMVHLMGVNDGCMIGQRARIDAATALPAFANLFVLSANACMIRDIEFFQGPGSTTLSAAQTAVTISGVRNRFVNCQISGIGDATQDYAGSNSLTITGDENIFQHCYIGLDTVIRSTATTEVVISGTPARLIFEDCQFNSYTSLTTFKAVQIGTSVDRFVKFKNCEFSASVHLPSVGVPTGAIGITTMNGQVMLINPAIFGYALASTGGNAYVKVVTFQAGTSVQGIGQSAAAS